MLFCTVVQGRSSTVLLSSDSGSTLLWLSRTASVPLFAAPLHAGPCSEEAINPSAHVES